MTDLTPAPPVPGASPPTVSRLRIRMVRRTALALLAVVGLLGGVLYWMDWRNRQAQEQRKERSRAHVILRPTDEAQDWRVKEGARMEELGKRIEEQGKTMKELGDRVDQLKDQLKDRGEADRRGKKSAPPVPPLAQLPPLAEILPQPTPATPTKPGPRPPSTPAPPADQAPHSEGAEHITIPSKPKTAPRAQAAKAEPKDTPTAQEKAKPTKPEPVTTPKLRVITPRAQAKTARAAPGQTITPVGWLPSGSFIPAMLLSGVDAGTGTGSSLPYPVLMRLTDPAVLPNFAKMDVAECFVIGAAFGDLPSERAYIRTETLSCLRRGGGIVTIDGDLKGHAIGEDGKLGLRGRVVSKEGAIIARSLLAGFLSGLGQTFRPRITLAPTFLGSPQDEQSFQLPPLGDTLQAAAISGIGRSMELLAQYYLRQAQNLYPIIEINAGRQVDLVVLKGMPLKFTIRRTAAMEAGAGQVLD